MTSQARRLGGARPARPVADVTSLALSASGTARAGELSLGLVLALHLGEVVGLVGPNGAGKSATLAVLLGLLPLDAGEITACGQVVDDGRRPTAPHRRGLGWCPQQPSLLPRRPPPEQVSAFARRDAPLTSGDGVERLLASVALSASDHRRPEQLSSGERQRVAVARALAASPVVLLDEPTSAQDAHGAAAVRRSIRRHAECGGAALVVAHRPEDAYAIADRLIVLDRGAVVQSGTPAELAAHPTTPYVARVVGATVLEGVVEGSRISGAWGELTVPDHSVSGQATAVVHPTAVALHLEPPSGSARNVLQGTVAGLYWGADGVRVELATRPPLVAALTAAAASELDLRVGDRVWATVKANEVQLTASG